MNCAGFVCTEFLILVAFKVVRKAALQDVNPFPGGLKPKGVYPALRAARTTAPTAEGFWENLLERYLVEVKNENAE